MKSSGKKGGANPPTEQPDDGGCRLAADDPDFVRQMALAEKIMRDDREILRALAK